MIELTETAVDAECKEVAWEMFCRAHPVEAHEMDHEAFWTFFKSEAPGVTKKRMRQLLKECA